MRACMVQKYKIKNFNVNHIITQHHAEREYTTLYCEKWKFCSTALLYIRTNAVGFLHMQYLKLKHFK